ncbi:MAG: hypothetical protein LIR46_02465 [Bacteroidota bacterium]|nr:hypothetical protein [Bacteroidota bacterium]
MSQGLTAYDFVQQVYYAQEKVVLDFWPNDDKYKEVLMEANLVLQELQNSEDWTWLREQLVLGDTRMVPNEIPEYQLPEWVYKASTLNNDSLKLYRIKPMHHCHCHCHHPKFGSYDLWDYIEVPFASTGDNQHRKDKSYNGRDMLFFKDNTLRAIRVGNVVTFNRLLTPFESNRVAVIDVQKQIEQFHICDDYCKGVDETSAISYERGSDGKWVNPCSKINDRYLTEIPDPNYVVIATAARHAEGSPPAQSRIQGLTDQAQKILSAMRSNDAAATDADYFDYDTFGYIEVV